MKALKNVICVKGKGLQLLVVLNYHIWYCNCKKLFIKWNITLYFRLNEKNCIIYIC